MKIAPIMEETAKYPARFQQVLVHTGQHYDPVLRPGRMCDNMSKVFFKDLELPQPDIYLGMGSGSHAQQTARIMLAVEPVQEETGRQVGESSARRSCSRSTSMSKPVLREFSCSLYRRPRPVLSSPKG